MAGPLEGTRVIDLGTFVVGPSAAAILADWGADVIKIEPPDGDPNRAWTTDRNPTFELDNRGKRSITLDLKVPEALGVLHELLSDADVLVTNLRPRVLESFALDYPSIADRYPALVYAAITGYGDRGPDRDRAAYDGGAFWARAGVLATMTLPDGELPYAPGGSGDHITAITSVAGIGAALANRAKTGRGQQVSTSLFRAGIFTIGADVNRVLRLGDAFGTRRRTEVPNPLYNSYQCADGRHLFLLGLQPDRHWEALVAAVDSPQLLTDPRFATAMDRAVNAPALIGLLSAVFASDNYAHWTAALDAHGMWWAPIQGPMDIPDDPQAVAAGAFIEAPVTEGMATMVATPVDFSATPWSVSRRAPEVGEHTEELLLERGLTWDQISALREAGALG
jgi:crotonobetainyl-CoA:carnitine CoA-transferase CaiB-like acyl-CoA transferase